MQDLATTLLGAGREASELDVGQAALRAVVAYVAVLAMVRLGKKRFMGRGTAFDVIVGIVIGSMAGRAITGNAQLSTALAGIAVILVLHWIFSGVAVRWHGFGVLVKGRSELVIRDGQVDEAALRREHLTHQDLEEDLRNKGRRDAAEIAEGRIERDGALSILDEKRAPRVIDIAVKDGVQTVRITLN